MTQTIDFAFTRQDRLAAHDHYVPFDVPAGTTRNDIAIDYNKREDHCWLDIGLYPASSPDLVFVRATEVSTSAGHANAYGIDGMVQGLTSTDRVERPWANSLVGELIERAALEGLLS